MPTPLTRSELQTWLADGVSEIFDELREEWNDDLYDRVFQYVDATWHQLGCFPYGQIAGWQDVVSGKLLADLATALNFCEEENCVEDDSGLWEGLLPCQAIGSQTFFSLVARLSDAIEWELRNYESDHPCDDCKYEECIGKPCSECYNNLLWEEKEDE